MATKAKPYCVKIDGVPYLVEALTLQGAVRDVVAEIAKKLAERATVDLATGEQLYLAGKKGLPILNSERYARGHDPNQLPLVGVPETIE